MQHARSARPGRGPAAQQAPRQVRIIGGQWKRTPLAVPDAAGLRPTPDRVRETLFNWLHHLLAGDWAGRRCLDLFAGTGALGFEAASRGVAEVLMVESHPAALRLMQASREKLRASQVEIRRGDALAVVQALLAQAGPGPEGRFDVIFLDPPYHQAWLEKILPLCAGLLSRDGLVYAESEQSLGEAGSQPAAPVWLQGWTVLRSDQAGMVNYHLLKRN